MKTVQDDIVFARADTPEERASINAFLALHNQRGTGSTKGYVAYFAATKADHILAAAKFCPLHTPQAARFFAGDDWRHVYCLQRLAACRAPENLLSQFLAWCLKQMGKKDPRVWYVATYADSGTIDPRNGRYHDGTIYRATGAVSCGMTKGGRVEGFYRDGQRHSMRCGPRTYRVRDLKTINARAQLEGKPEPIKLIRTRPMYRYCWPVGSPLQRAFRRRMLLQRMVKYQGQPIVYQPRLLATITEFWTWLAERLTWRYAL